MPAQARALQRGTRQSPYKMRLVIDQIRGLDVNEALTLLAFSKKHAAREITKVLKSAVANVEYHARQADESVDVDQLYIKHAIATSRSWSPSRKAANGTEDESGRFSAWDHQAVALALVRPRSAVSDA